MKAICLFVLLTIPIAARGQVAPASCEVRQLWSIKGGVRSANLGSLGSFETNGKEGITVRTFKLPDTTLVVNVGIDFRFDYSHKPRPAALSVALAIDVSDSDKKDLFESTDSAEASTLYEKNWNLSVTKNIALQGKTYMVTLSCWDKRSGCTPKAGNS